jgi:hypothetical protein
VSINDRSSRTIDTGCLQELGTELAVAVKYLCPSLKTETLRDNVARNEQVVAPILGLTSVALALSTIAVLQISRVPQTNGGAWPQRR